MAQGHLSNCCTSSSCFERSCFLQSIRGSSNPRENGRSNFTLKLHVYPSIICRQFVLVRASLPPHHHHPSSSSLTSAATSSSSSNKTLQCPPPHGLLLRYTSLSRRTGGFVPCNAARSSALSESEEMMPTTSRRVTDNRLPQLVDVVPPVVEFKLSDFELCSHVSVGLAGRVSVFVFPLFLFMSALFWSEFQETHCLQLQVQQHILPLQTECIFLPFRVMFALSLRLGSIFFSASSLTSIVLDWLCL